MNAKISTKIELLLKNKFVDKTTAILACLPLCWVLVSKFHLLQTHLGVTVLYVNLLLVIIPMLFRRTPARVTLNIGYWILAICGTYWPIIWSEFMVSGTRLMPSSYSYFLLFLSLSINIFARFSLGRSIGFVPADRGITHQGAYHFVRHPIYTAIILNSVAILTANYHLINLIICLTHCSLYIAKSFVEEKFLVSSKNYSDYLTKVKYRFIPGII